MTAEPSPSDEDVANARQGEFAPLAIGPLSVWPPVVLAPMAGVTNAPFRQLCRRFGAGLYVSEMVTARALVEGNERSRRLAGFAPGESPRSLQLYGTDPHAIAAAVELAVGPGRVDHIDLNFGCPAKKITRHGGGAAIPVKRRLLAAIVGAAVRAAGPVPVTIKFRKGIDDTHTTYLDAGRIGRDEGAAAVALHARTAEDHYGPPADWSAIARLKDAVTEIPVLGNGDVWEAPDALRMLRSTGCDGVVVGRGCLGRPWLFGDLASLFDGADPAPPPTVGEMVPVMLDHVTALVDWLGPVVGVRDFRKHTAWYVKGYPVGAEMRRQLAQITSIDQLAGLLHSIDPSIPLPDDARRMPRGHTSGPRPVSLPDGWLDQPDVMPPVRPDAEALVSGG